MILTDNELFKTNHSPLMPLKSSFLMEHQIQLSIKRDDLIQPAPSGNKWRKLKYNLKEVSCLANPKLLTFGGAFSNHIYATAAAGNRFRIPTIGIIRGERVEPLNSTLDFAETCGMDLHFVDRNTYRRRNEPDFIKELKEKFGDCYILPEGGTNHLAIKGCAEIVEELEEQMQGLPDYICTPCGTGGTISGIIAGLASKKTKAIGFSALKGDFLRKEVNNLLRTYQKNTVFSNWEINADYHFGGYAKFDSILIDFINDFKRDYDIQLDPIYTGKLFYGVFDLIQKGFFPKESTIVVVHTGGLQGLNGFRERFGKIL